MNQRSVPGLEHEPALDGMRAVAVAVVLLFHADVRWMRGGYVGVSVFFTLSGFLITRLLLAEHAGTGRIALGGFYARRLRRLLPASLVCVMGVIAAARLGWFTPDDSLRRDVSGAVLQIANWVSLNGTDSYGDLLHRIGGTASPLAHYWSLAIEEQFYWLWPPVLLALLYGRPSPGALARRIGAVTLGFAVLAVWIAVRFGPDAAYWATPARAGEILVGAALAAVLRVHPVRPSAAWFGPPALLLIVIAAVVFPAGDGPAYMGLMPVFALVSAALIVALLTDGPTRSLLRLPALAACGRVSYGLYLYHWPVFIILDEARTGQSGVTLIGLRLATTTALATASFVLLESPIRRQAWRPHVTAGLAVAASAVMLVATGTIAVAGTDYWRASRLAVSAGELQAITADAGPAPIRSRPLERLQDPRTEPVADRVEEPSPAPRTTLPYRPPDSAPLVPDRPVRIIVTGDSTAEATGGGLLTWAAAHPELASVGVRTNPGCGMMLEGVVPADGDDDFTTPCREVLERELPADIATLRPDVVVIEVTLRDLVDRVWSDAEGPLTPFDPRFQERLIAAYVARNAEFVGAGVARVVWLIPPIPDMYWLPQTSDYEDPERFTIQRAAIEAAAATDPAIRIVDLSGWAAEVGLLVDHAARPDGLHWAPETAAKIAEEWLGQQLIDAALT